jgi:osmoprotectant transport system substrate-binding protein
MRSSRACSALPRFLPNNGFGSYSLRKACFSMKLKGMWFRILGLLVVLSFITACGGGTDTTGSAAPSAAESSVVPASSAAPASEAAASAEAPAAGSGEPIRVGSKNFTEAYIMAEMYAQLLEAAGFEVERKLDLGATDIAHQALLNDEIDLYPEYTSTALLTVLGQEKIDDPQEIVETVRSQYEEQFELTWLEPSPFNDTNALAMKRERAEELGIQTYTDLFNNASQLVIGGPPEFFESEQGLRPLQELYGGEEFQDTRQVDPGLRYQALLSDEIDVVVAFSTEAQLAENDLVVLEDDRGFYPIYQVAPVVRQDVLEANPGIADALNVLNTPELDEETMSALNGMVDIDGMEPADVARDWLTEQGLLQP